jgi:hypothetical protein
MSQPKVQKNRITGMMTAHVTFVVFLILRPNCKTCLVAVKVRYLQPFRSLLSGDKERRMIRNWLPDTTWLMFPQVRCDLHLRTETRRTDSAFA